MSLVKEEKVYGRYLTVYDRQVEFTHETTGEVGVGVDDSSEVG
jgi:hypothetical protein